MIVWDTAAAMILLSVLVTLSGRMSDEPSLFLGKKIEETIIKVTRRGLTTAYGFEDS